MDDPLSELTVTVIVDCQLFWSVKINKKGEKIEKHCTSISKERNIK